MPSLERVTYHRMQQAYRNVASARERGEPTATLVLAADLAEIAWRKANAAYWRDNPDKRAAFYSALDTYCP